MITLFKGIKWNTYYYYKTDNSRYDDTYFGEDSVRKIDDKLYLGIEEHQKKFDNKERSICCAEINSVKGFSYGTFTWKVSLPKQPNIWPAIWLCGKQSWPPEIDVFEGYTDNKGHYSNILTTKLKSNIHYEVDGKHLAIGGKGIPTVLYKLWRNDNGIDEWKCVWTPNYIKFYFNNHLTRTVKDKQVLSSLNKDHCMYAKMNMMVLEDFKKSDINGAMMIIHDFKYEKLK